MKRKIPATLVTQHPDHANKPYWHHDAFIGTHEETYECFLSYSDLGATEYKWDWEGKYVDESVIERLYSEHYDYFCKNKLGKDVFLTFRLPNPEVETEFRVGRAFMGILSASSLAEQVKLHNPPMFEVILPMTENAEQMIAIQEAFHEIATLEHRLFHLKEGTLKHINLIPLFEEINITMDSDKILEEYVADHEKKFGFTPEYIRPYVARSDPALNAGIVPTVLAIKIALSHFADFEKKHGIKLYPMIGAACLPFRGGISPKTVEDFVNEYAGIKTTTIQSAFRYDYDKKDVKRAIKYLEDELPKSKARKVSADEEKRLRKMIPVFENYYKKTVEAIAPTINFVASNLPKRRERVQHVGLFGYSRGIGKVKLPRAIGFTASLYSLGVPPELIGTGRSLAEAVKSGELELIEKHYINLRKDMDRVGRFLNKENLEILAKKDPAWSNIKEDVRLIEEILGMKLKPKTKDEKEHGWISSEILRKANFKTKSKEKGLTNLISQAAILRRSLG